VNQDFVPGAQLPGIRNSDGSDVRSIQRSPGLFSNRPQADEAGNFPADADADPEQLEMLRALMAGFPSEVTVEELTSARSVRVNDF
jgi:hypothetical protein